MQVISYVDVRELFSANGRHFSVNGRHFSVKGRHFSVNGRHFSVKGRHFSVKGSSGTSGDGDAGTFENS